MLILIKGAGDIATGAALRLVRAGMRVIMTDLPAPTAIRRTVSFSQAIYQGEAKVEDVCAKLACTPFQALDIINSGCVAVLADERAACIPALSPDAVVDAILAKKNTGTRITDAPTVIALGPGFTAGVDCHAAIETMRGHDLGRVYYEKGQSPMKNTGIPGSIGGYTSERVMHAEASGVFRLIRDIGSAVKAGETVALIGDVPVRAKIDGVLRGILQDGTEVFSGMKCADVDPRGDASACYTVSDKARSIGGAVLEAVLHFSMDN